ncbi:hypothetical protein ACOMHN_017139 [Nucella lapillus]
MTAPGQVRELVRVVCVVHVVSVLRVVRVLRVVCVLRVVRVLRVVCNVLAPFAPWWSAEAAPGQMLVRVVWVVLVVWVVRVELKLSGPD